MIAVAGGMQKFSYRMPDWSLLPMRALMRSGASYPWPRPPQLERMLGLASRLGRHYGSYVRVDFYESDGDPVFAEFSPMPTRGRTYTPELNAYLDGLWERHCPGTVQPRTRAGTDSWIVRLDAVVVER